jgi:hypothetical protein
VALDPNGQTQDQGPSDAIWTPPGGEVPHTVGGIWPNYPHGCAWHGGHKALLNSELACGKKRHVACFTRAEVAPHGPRGRSSGGLLLLLLLPAEPGIPLCPSWWCLTTNLERIP